MASHEDGIRAPFLLEIDAKSVDFDENAVREDRKAPAHKARFEFFTGLLGRKNGDALCSAWYPVERLTEQRESMGSRAFSSLYQQPPVPETGNLVKSDWLSARYQRLPADMTTIAALDAATKAGVANDYSVVVVLGVADASYYVLDVIRWKVEYPDLRRMVEAAFATHHPSRMYVEDASNGTPLIQTLRRETRLPIVSIIPKGSKIARFEAVSGLLESRRVLLPEDAPWLDAFIPELLRFPSAPHDGEVDALTLALSQASRKAAPVYFGVLRNHHDYPMPYRLR